MEMDEPKWQRRNPNTGNNCKWKVSVREIGNIQRVTHSATIYFRAFTRFSLE